MYLDWRYWLRKVTPWHWTYLFSAWRYYRLIDKGWSQPDAMNRVYGRDEDE